MNDWLLLPLGLLLAACSGPAGASPHGAAEQPGGGAGASARSTAARADKERLASAAIDALHAAASRADADAYFAIFAPDAIFLGTDATERWTVEQFRAWAAPYFSRGQGWTYVLTERHVFLSAAGDVAWFDERLHNDKYGEVRGSGVLVDGPHGWRIAQYNLAMPVPNELAADLVTRIRAAGR